MFKLAAILILSIQFAYADTYIDDIDCLADNIYFESGNQSELGKKGTAYVTINRKNHKYFPNTICDVVHQTNRKACQFSWTCDNKPNQINTKNIQYKVAWDVAFHVYYNYEHEADPTQGALFYHANYVSPDWNFKLLTYTGTIGVHLYYRLKNG